MLPREKHIQMINAFHDRLAEVDSQIEAMRKEHGDDTSKYTEDVLNRVYNLSSEYYNLTSKMWPSIDNFLEYEVNEKIDILEHKDKMSRELYDRG